MRNVALAAVLILFAAAADPRPADVSVTGPGAAKPGHWSVERIKADFAAEVKEVSYVSHGRKQTSHAVPLLSLLKAAGVPTGVGTDPKADPKVKNRALRLAVTCASDDGYAATFSLGELLAEGGDRAVWVAVDADGKPLAGRDVPVKLIVPDDNKPGRWVHGVTTITVVDPTAAATTQPATQPAK